MTVKGIGRNAPCPCGSGRKYKHCCLRSGEAAASLSAAASQAPPIVATAGEPDDLRSLAEEAIRQASPEEARELREKWALIEEMAAYEAVSDEVEAACEALEAHRGEFEALREDLEAAAGRFRELFSQDDFAPMRFTAEDIHRAFEAVGYPELHIGDAEAIDEVCASAITFLADETYRARASRRLMALLPRYVADGRYLDAWLIQYCAYQTLQAPQQSNPFLFHSFWHGLAAWQARVAAEDRAVMQELGLDAARVQSMDIQEALDLAKQQMADPAKSALVEARLAEQPMMADQARALSQELERGALHLLERDDARRLYLAAEELAPWVPVLAERSQPTMERVGRLLEQGGEPDDAAIKEMQDVLLQVAREMAPAVFTPERLARYVAELRDYWRALRKAGELDAAACACAAALQLEHEAHPGDNWLLIATCYASLHSLASRPAEAGAGVEAEDEAAAGASPEE